MDTRHDIDPVNYYCHRCHRLLKNILEKGGGCLKAESLDSPELDEPIIISGADHARQQEANEG